MGLKPGYLLKSFLLLFFCFLGFGFGLPLFDEAPKPFLTCGRTDFEELVKEFGLEGGLQPLIDDGARPKKLKSIVKSFGVLLYSRHKCIDKNKNIESRKVHSAFSSLMSALYERIESETYVP